MAPLEQSAVDCTSFLISNFIFMKKIDKDGDLVTINNTTFNLNDVVSVRPQTLVTFWYSGYGGEPKETGRDFPKIIVKTKNDTFEFPFRTDVERDDALRELTEVLKINQKEKSNLGENPTGNISINVADSSHVNIVTKSSTVKISQHQEKEAKELITQIKEALKAEREIDRVVIEEIGECLDDIESKVASNEKIPRLTFKGLLENTANSSQIGSLVITLGQVLGMIPS